MGCCLRSIILDRQNWWEHLESDLIQPLDAVWIPIGLPGFAGGKKGRWREVLDGRFGVDGWRLSHLVRGEVVPKAAAILEYEAGYRSFLRKNRPLVEFLITACGNVYDDNITNVYDHQYAQPHTETNHYQDISVRRVIAELIDDPAWPEVTATPVETAPLIDLNDGQTHLLPRAAGFRGRYLLQIREPDSPGYFLNPAVVPIHDPELITTLPNRREWYHREGCAHLSVEAFWQMSKILEVRYSRFLALKNGREDPLNDL